MLTLGALPRLLRRPAILAIAFLLVACTTASTSPTPTPGAIPAPTPTGAASPPASLPPTPAPTSAPTAVPVTLCTIKALAATIVAGSVSHASGGLLGFEVTIKNAGSVACTLRQQDQIKMVDKNGVPMITGPVAATSALLFLNTGASLTTTVQARNFCAGVPVEPVTVEFVLPDGVGTLRAKPLATDPGSIVPSCFQGGVAGSISMSGWGP